MKLKVLTLFMSALFAYSGFTAFSTTESDKPKQLKVTRITPNGEDVPAGRQIVFQFNRPVVPIGRMERNKNEIPVKISPKLECQWRWLNTSALTCQLDDRNKLQKATKYTITINPGIYAEDGATTNKTHTHSFITQRPQTRNAWINNWQGPSNPVVTVTFNQAVSKSTVEKHTAFTYLNADDIYIKQATKIEKLPTNQENPEITSAPKSNKKAKAAEKDIPRKIWLVSPQKKLPLDTSFSLRVSPGLVSSSGKETGIEDRIVANFHSFPEFTFLGVYCTTNDNKKILITKKNSEAIGKCNPLKRTALSFSTPVAKSQIKNNISIQPDLAGGKKDYDPWANRTNYFDNFSLRQNHKKNNRYNVWLPKYLKAAQSYTLKTKHQKPKTHLFDKIKPLFSSVSIPNVEDKFGRTLKNPIDITFFTDHRNPDFYLAHRTAVLEEQISSDVPLYVTNLDSVTLNYQTLTSSGKKGNQTLHLNNFAKTRDVRFAIPMRIREMLGNKSGAVFGTIDTNPSIKKASTRRAFLAIISPYQLHVKIGHFNTLIWVTDLATGKPVQNARVQIYKGYLNNTSPDSDALDSDALDIDVLDIGHTDASGLALLKGRRELDPKSASPTCYYQHRNCLRLFIRVDKADKIALMPLKYNFEVSVYRTSNETVWSSQKRKYGHVRTWGTTAQGVYRAGDTMQYKLYVRDQSNATYVPAPVKTYKLEIIDPAKKTVHEIKNITLSKFGSHSGEYTVPKNAIVGWYSFKLSSDFYQYTWNPMRVLVSDFNPSSFKVKNSLNGDLFHPGEKVEITSSAKLYSGGTYTQAQGRITATLQAAYFSSKHPVAAKFIFDSYKHRQSKKVFQKIDTIDNKGEMHNSFILPKEDIVFGYLTVESAVQDDRGKYVAASSRADYLAVNRLVGLQSTKWVYEINKPANIKYIVVDENGVPTSDTNVSLKIEYLQTKSAKVKGVGNTYLTNYIDKWIAVDNCECESKTEPATYSFMPKKSGIYRTTATIKDTQGNLHSTKIKLFVVSTKHIVWRSPNDNSLQIIPEKTEYNIGDKARYLIKNPYPEATALISIERYGVLKSWVQKLKGSAPVIEFDIGKNFMPGFYLSVVVVSPRVEAPPTTIGQIDLGKPAFKVGYIKVPVRDPYKQIDISIKTDAKVYKPHDTITATIHVEPKHKDNNEEIEIAVTVLDEAVLDLIQKGEAYFDPYENFYKLNELDLRNYSLLSRLIGRQKFAKKGANPGGDGGANISIRSLFRHVSYWNPSVKPDKNGNASISFKAPDNLTGWKILAFAVTPTDRMGLGNGSFKVNRPTEIRPVMPNQVTEGDTFQAKFSIRNRTDKPRNLKVSVQTTGNIKATEPFSTLLHLEPYKRKTVTIPVHSTNLPQDTNSNTGAVHFIARASDAIDADSIKYSLPIHKLQSLETIANYGTTTKNTVYEPLHFPDKIHPNTGKISVTLSPSVIGSIAGVFRGISDANKYTYWEYQLSKGIMASHYQNLQNYLPDNPEWNTHKSLPEDILKQAANYQAPNGGMSYFTSQDNYVSPYLSAYTALAFNWLHENGHSIPKAVETKLHKYLSLLLRKNTLPAFYSNGMSSTVRAVALAALARQGKVSLNDLERYRSHVKYMSLFGKAHYLQAALEIKNAEAIAKEVMNDILNYSSQSAGNFSFNEKLDDSYARILATPLRANCVILSSLIKYDNSQTGASLIGDVALKLLRSIVETSGNHKLFQNTQEDVFCVNSLVDYSRRYEKTEPNIQVSVTLDKNKFGKTSFNNLRHGSTTFNQPITTNELGTKSTIAISRKGKGRLYYTTSMSYSPIREHPTRVNAGIDIRKEYSVERNSKWVLLNNFSELYRGELVRVDIYVSLPTARNFAVVSDPVPGGLEPVNNNLATTSVVDADKGNFQVANGSWWHRFNDWQHFNSSRWRFYHKELRHNAARFYSDYLPAGNYHLSYTAQAIAEGKFIKMPVHIEEIYNPDIFGKGLPGTLRVKKQPAAQ